MYNGVKTRSILFFGLLLPCLAQASDNVRTDAFITAGGSFSDSNVPIETVAKDLNFGQLSRIGLQYTYTPSHDIPITFTGQLLARGSNNWNTDTEWALISYRPSLQWAVNAGRIRTSMLMYSQVYDVGVNYPWSTPPEETYGLYNIPFTSINGIEVINSQLVGDWSLKTKFQLGNSNFSVPTLSLNVPVKLDNFHLVQFNLNKEAFTFNFSYTLADFQTQELSIMAADPRVQGGFAALAQKAGIPAEQLADPSTILGLANSLGVSNTTNGKTALYNVGFIYDDNILLIAEGSKRRISNSTFPTVETGFLTMGYRFDTLTPHLTFALNNSSNSLILQEQKSITLGLNLSPSSSSVLKFEFKHIAIADGALALPIPNTFINNVGLYDTLPTVLGGEAIEDRSNKLSVTLSVVL